jgi:hypothetical protein
MNSSEANKDGGRINEYYQAIEEVENRREDETHQKNQAAG